jgi:hypothetical protein
MIDLKTDKLELSVSGVQDIMFDAVVEDEAAQAHYYRTLHIRTADTELVLTLASDDPNRLHVKTVIVEQSEPAPGGERDK